MRRYDFIQGTVTKVSINPDTSSSFNDIHGMNLKIEIKGEFANSRRLDSDQILNYVIYGPEGFCEVGDTVRFRVENLSR